MIVAMSPLHRTEASVCRQSCTAAQRGVILRLEKKDSLPMSTNRPTAPATSPWTSNPDFLPVDRRGRRRVSSIIGLNMIHSSGPMSRGFVSPVCSRSGRNFQSGRRSMDSYQRAGGLVFCPFKG